MVGRVPYSVPHVSVDSKCSPTLTYNGGRLYTLPTGWKFFMAWTGSHIALVRPNGTVALRGAWAGSGKFADGFHGDCGEFGMRTPRKEALLRMAGVEVVERLPLW